MKIVDAKESAELRAEIEAAAVQEDALAKQLAEWVAVHGFDSEATKLTAATKQVHDRKMELMARLKQMAL